MTANLFDAAYYIAVNPDLVAAGLTTSEQLFSHFQNFGLNEGRVFSSVVNLNFYRDSNADLSSAGLRTNRQFYDHLQTFGIAEGRQFSPWVDLNFYLAANPDVNTAFQGDRERTFDHLQNLGIVEGRQFSPVVDLDFYLNDNLDVWQAFGGNRQRTFEHLQNQGIAERRQFSLTFDPTYYRQVNRDLATAGLDNRQLLKHFQLFGLNEGRASSEYFNLPFYLKINPDLVSAGLNNQQALQHFALFGLPEHRWPFNGFSERTYLQANPDVSQAVERGWFSSGFEHYFKFGAAEGRVVRIFSNPNPDGTGYFAVVRSLILGDGYDRFGSSVATLGNNLLVGVPGDDASGFNSGVAYLFNGTTGKVLQTFQNPLPGEINPTSEEINPALLREGDGFGTAVTAVGNNVLIGAPLEDTGAMDAGIAYLFDSITGALVRTFQAPNPETYDQFGYWVTVVGNNVLIAAPFKEQGGNFGVAYLFDSNTGALLQTFQNPIPGSYQFGSLVAAVGDNVLIGEPYSGIAYLFDGETGQLLQTFQNPNSGSFFGSFVAAVGDDVLIGAPGPFGSSEPGVAHLFDGNTGTLLQTFQNPRPFSANDPCMAPFSYCPIPDRFGASVAAMGNHVLIGAPGEDTGRTDASPDLVDAGAAYLFDASTGALVRSFPNPIPGTTDYFGTSLAILGDRFLVGSPDITVNNLPDTGALYLF